MIIDIEVGNGLEMFAKDVPYFASRALNDVVFKAREKNTEKMINAIDNPTPFTKKGIRYKRSSKKNLVSSVYVEKNREDYLKFLYQGGIKKPKSKALRGVTKNTRTNKYGNITKNKVNIQLANKKKFFNGIPNGARKREAGIWERMGRGGRKSIRMVLAWDREWKYEKKLDFYRPVQKIVADDFQRLFYSYF